MNDACGAGIAGSHISQEHWLAIRNTPDNLGPLIEVKVQPNVIPFWTLKSSV